MKTKVLNYNVLIKRESYKNGETVYVASAPTLGISDYAETSEKALKNIQKLIKFHIDSLVKENEAIPEPDNASSYLITNSQVEIRTDQNFAFS